MTPDTRAGYRRDRNPALPAKSRVQTTARYYNPDNHRKQKHFPVVGNNNVKSNWDLIDWSKS